MISKRQEKILYIIIKEYIENAIPIGSKLIIKKYMPELSAATIRNDMSILEKEGYITKVHNSSGRVPSVKGYKYFDQNFNDDSHNFDLQKKLKKIFRNRSLSIDDIISKSVELISDTFKLPTVISSIEEEILIKRIDLIQMSKNSAIIVVITSDGNVVKNIVEFDNENQLRDISICIRIFNDRLIDTPISEVNDKLTIIKGIIKEKVEEYEFIFEEIINRIFQFSRNKAIRNKVNGQSNLLTQPEFKEQEKLMNVMKLLENSSVWEMFALKQHKSGGKTSITFGKDIYENEENLSIVSTEIITGDKSSTCISLVGPIRIDYTNVKSILNFIKIELEKRWKE